jgi:hypothetical protein
MRITQQAFNEWVNKYYEEVLAKIRSGEMTWHSFGKDMITNNCTKPKGILLSSIRNGKVARSYCHEDDEWNIRTGLAVAYARFMGVEIPQAEKSYLASELVGKEIMYHGNRVFITPYGNNWCVYTVSEGGIVKFIDKGYIIFESDICKEDG